MIKNTTQKTKYWIFDYKPNFKNIAINWTTFSQRKPFGYLNISETAIDKYKCENQVHALDFNLLFSASSQDG